MVRVGPEASESPTPVVPQFDASFRERLRASARRKQVLARVVFLGPLTVLMVGLLAFPIGYAIYMSLAEPTMGGLGQFDGLAHYRELLTSRSLGRALRNTVVFTLSTTLLELTLGMAAALLLHAQVRGRRWFRLGLLLPWVIPPVVTALLWRWILHADLGLLNQILVNVGILSESRSWLGSPDTAMAMLVLTNAWRGFPFMALLFLAGLQTISRDVQEAAMVDGAGDIQRFRHVTLPALRYIVVLATTLNGLWAFREFALIDVLTGGGPAGATEVAATLVYRLFFRFQSFGEASALGVIMLITAFVGSFVYMRALQRQER